MTNDKQKTDDQFKIFFGRYQSRKLQQTNDLSIYFRREKIIKFVFIVQ